MICRNWLKRRVRTAPWAIAAMGAVVLFGNGAARAEPSKPAAAGPKAATAAARPAVLPPGYDDTPFLPHSPWRVHDRRRPQAPLVEPGQQPGAAPADALVLFDGKDLSQWQGGNPQGIEAGTINILKTGELRSKREFGDCQVHVEWMTPAKDDGGPMNWGNSGVFMMDLFEIQIIESRASHIYADGNAGAIYGQTPPLVNASRKPGQWQTYEILFTAPRFQGGKLLEPARATVLQNGVLVQYHQAILGATRHKTFPVYPTTATQGPIRLQQHHSAVRFRNIWVRPLKLDAPPGQ
jgi:hypothetical protein